MQHIISVMSTLIKCAEMYVTVVIWVFAVRGLESVVYHWRTVCVKYIVSRFHSSLCSKVRLNKFQLAQYGIYSRSWVQIVKWIHNPN